MCSGCCAALWGTSRWRQRCGNTTRRRIRRPDYFEQLLEGTSGQKLDWFFNDWVDRDRGLPDLSIDDVTPSTGSEEDSLYCRRNGVEFGNRGGGCAGDDLRPADATVTARCASRRRAASTHRFLAHGRPQQVQVNDGTTPETEASVHRKDITYTAPIKGRQSTAFDDGRGEGAGHGCRCGGGRVSCSAMPAGAGAATFRSRERSLPMVPVTQR